MSRPFTSKLTVVSPPQTKGPDATRKKPRSEDATGIAHDARNLLASLELYCELLAIPGVLTPRFRHYAEDLRRVSETGGRLLASLAGCLPETPRHPFPAIEDLGAEVMAMKDLLQSLAGRDIRVEVECAPSAGRLGLNSEDLLRVLFNLIANAAEAMHCSSAPKTLTDAQVMSSKNRGTMPTGRPASPLGGMIRITVQRGGGASFLPPSSPTDSSAATVVLSVRDNGPGIAPESLPWIFTPGFSTRKRSDDPQTMRGVGLAVVRELVEAAGGAVRAVSTPGAGARFDLELPVQPHYAHSQWPEVIAGTGEVSWSKNSHEISSHSGKKGAYNADTFRF